jgi:hypothetical protein
MATHRLFPCLDSSPPPPVSWVVRRLMEVVIDTIPIQPYGTITGYSTAKEAIQAAAKNPLRPKALEDSAILYGRRFVGAACDQRRWLIEFSGPMWLEVSVGPAGVDWAVSLQTLPLEPIVSPIKFEWRSGQVSTMDCNALSEPRLGADFWQLWVTELGLLLYLRGLPILNFHAVERRDTGELMLFVCDGD